MKLIFHESLTNLHRAAEAAEITAPYAALHADSRVSARGRSLGNAVTFHTSGKQKQKSPFHRIRLSLTLY